MKKILFLVCVLLSSLCFAQDKEKITGKWKIVAMHDNDMYFDLAKDSFYIKQNATEDKKEEMTDATMKASKEMLKGLLDGAFFLFKSDMTFIGNFMDEEKKGRYNLDEINKTITFITQRKSSSVKGPGNKETAIKYTFRNNRLVLLDIEGETGDGFNLELEKQ